VLSEILGRTTDFVVRADGTIMHALAVIYVLRAVEGIAEFKFIQHSVGDVEVLVVADARWTDVSRSQVAAGLADRLGAEVRVHVRKVDAIPAEVSGKHRYVVSHVPLREVVALETVVA
jgi:phenylacetate-CoA ligase